MYPDILPVLRCPHCGEGFELTVSKKDGEEIIEGKLPAGTDMHFAFGKASWISSPGSRKN